MKNFVIFIFSIVSLNAFSADLDCQKSNSKITVDKKNVTIEGEAVMSDDLKAMVQRTNGSTDGSSKVSVKISFSKKDLKCTNGLAKVFQCSGMTKKASVEINISSQSMFGNSSMQLMRRPVKIENIDISSTAVTDEVNVASSMFVRMNGDFKLDLSQSFKSSAECK